MSLAWISLRSKTSISRVRAAAVSSLDADDRDDLVDVEDRDEAAEHEVQLLFAAAASVGRPSPHDFEPMVDVDLEQFLQPERERLAVDQRDVVDTEGVFHRRESIELVEDRLGVEAVLDLDDELQPVLAVGEVAHVGNALQLARMHEVLDLRDDLLGPDAVRQFGDDDAALARAHVGDLRGRSDAEHATAGLIRLAHAVEADDLAAGR